MKEEIRRAIERVCNFVEEDEKTDYFGMKDNRKDVSDHIYEQVMTINKWLGSTASRTFPLHADRGTEPGPRHIPWAIAEEAYAEYSQRYGNSPSLDILAERGGFSWGEMDVFLPGWRDRVDLLKKRDDEIKELKYRLSDIEDTFKDVMAERGANDEVHCTCVPHLRRGINELKKDLSDVAHALATRGCDPTKPLGPQVLGRMKQLEVFDDLIEKAPPEDLVDETTTFLKHLASAECSCDPDVGSTCEACVALELLSKFRSLP